MQENSQLQRAFELFKKGQASERLDQYDRALEYYQDSLRLQPEHPELLYYLFNNIGYCLLKEKNFLKAEDYCRRAIRIDRNKFNAWKNLGISLESQGRIWEAAHCYALAVRISGGEERSVLLWVNLNERHPHLRGHSIGIQTFNAN